MIEKKYYQITEKRKMREKKNRTTKHFGHMQTSKHTIEKRSIERMFQRK